MQTPHEQFACTGACTCAILHDVTCVSQQISEMTLVALRRLLQRLYTARNVRDMTRALVARLTYCSKSAETTRCVVEMRPCAFTRCKHGVNRSPFSAGVTRVIAILCCRHIRRVQTRM